MVTSPSEWKILKLELKHYIINELINQPVRSNNVEHLLDISIGEVNNFFNVIVIQKTAFTKSSVGQHGLFKKAKVGSGTMKE
jgi:hypothetical protein